MGIERYRDIVDDWEAFQAAASRPEPVTLRVRTGRVSPGALARRLGEQGFVLEEVGGPPDVFRVVDGPFRVSRTLEHWLGLFYIQQAVTALAAPALDARPGELVLDMAAAPGGKTTHLADLMEDRGCLVAADRSEKRLRALLGNLYKAAHTNVTVLSADSRSFPDGVAFDRVLLDAPCSGEGNLRSKGGVLKERKASFTEHIVGVQRALLRRAVALARPGGTILYVTCTFDPEENEGVVDRIAGELPVTIEPIDLDAPHAPGLTASGDRRYRPEMRHAWRLYPHHLDSGGLFMARLRKDGGEGSGRFAPTAAGQAAPVDVAAGQAASLGVAVAPGDATPLDVARERVARVLAAFEEAFVLAPSLLRPFRWSVRGDSVWMGRVAGGVPDAWPPSESWRLVSTGMRAFKDDPRVASGARPTNDLLQWLDRSLAARVVDLDAGTAKRLVDREPLPVDGLDDGFVALRLEGRVVGRGWLRGGRVMHEIPKAPAHQLGVLLDASAGAVTAPPADPYLPPVRR